MDTLCIFTLLLFGSISCQDTAFASSQAIQSPELPVAPYYPEDNSQYYSDYGYPQNPSPPGPSFFSQLDRQGLETILGAPLVITAFAAAFFGGFMSPLISSGFSRLAEYEIEWPEVKRKTTPSKDIGKARDVEPLSWIEALEKVNKALRD